MYCQKITLTDPESAIIGQLFCEVLEWELRASEDDGVLLEGPSFKMEILTGGAQATQLFFEMSEDEIRELQLRFSFLQFKRPEFQDFAIQVKKSSVELGRKNGLGPTLIFQ